MTQRNAQALDPYASPFRGTGSYGPEDSVMFFGRDRESEQVVQMVLACRVSYLYAKSGVGKSSLLAARVYASLEQRGWLPIEIRLGDDPLDSTCGALKRQAVMSPRLEADCAVELVGRLGANLSLLDLADCCAQHLRQVPCDRALLRRRVAIGERVAVLPWLARVARGGLSAVEFMRALELLAAHGPGSWDSSPGLRLGDLCERLSDPLLQSAHQARMAELASMQSDLNAMLEACGSGHLPLVLVFDQFEELFTQFGDDSALLPTVDPLLRRRDWQLRHRFVQALAQVFGPAAPGLRGNRLLFSLREDFIAELEELRGVAPLAEQNTFRLGLLSVQHALEAIEEPMRRFGIPVVHACAQRVVDDLAVEQRYVYPSALQVVSERLWFEARERTISQVSLFLYLNELGGHTRILGEFFGLVLDQLTILEQVEALDLLDPLVTSSHKRNIVAREQLLNSPFRDPLLRREVLAFLERRHILRTERRYKGDFVEIAHEFLIQSIEHEREKRLRDEDRSAHRAIKQLRDRLAVEIDSNQPSPLEPLAFKAIDSVRHRLAWNAQARQLMLRSAINLTPEGFEERELHAARLTYWTQQLALDTEIHWSDIVERLREVQGSGEFLHRVDWQQLADRLNVLPSSLRRSDGTLRSALRWSGPEHADSLRGIVREWTTDEP